MSVRKRAVVSVLANLVRAATGFVTGMLLARELSPQGYGNLTFLVGTFVAARALLDLGVSNAFFTFISQRSRSSRLYLFYCVTQLSQFVFLVLLACCLIPDPLLHAIWVENDRTSVLLALCSAFMQQSIWQSIVQVGEAARRTLLVQGASVVVALISLGGVVLLSQAGYMSVNSMLMTSSVVYFSASVIVGIVLRPCAPVTADSVSSREIALEFWGYCKPMLWLAVFGGIYLFADKWVLQVYGGAVEQGFFQVASQFSLVVILVTTSVSGVFWKEIAAAWATNDMPRVAMLYKYATRTLVIVSVSIAGVIVPWSEEIVAHFLGREFERSWIVVAVMLICPIFQSLSQINGAFLMACSKTKLFSSIGVFGMLISLPISYWVVAPSTALVPGLAMGALGIALKELGTTVLMVCIQSFFIAANQNWRRDLVFPFAVVTAFLPLGFLVKLFVLAVTGHADMEMSKASLFASVTLSALVMLIILVAVGWLNRGALAPFLGRK